MKEEKQSDFWESNYESGQYLNHWDYKYPSQELVTFIASGIIPKDAKCLDLGCGAGNEAIFLAKCGYKVTGIDLSRKAIEIAKERSLTKNVKIDWIVGDVLASKLVSNSFDFINDRGCFHHIKEADRTNYANEMFRLLKTGGKLMIRGCGDEKSQEHFVLVDEKSIHKHFRTKAFDRGSILPIQMISDGGKLLSNLVILTKK